MCQCECVRVSTIGAGFSMGLLLTLFYICIHSKVWILTLLYVQSELLSRYLSQEVPTQLDQWLCNGMDLGDSLPLDEGVAFEKCEFGDIASWRKGFWSNQSVLELGAGLGKCY